MRAVVVGCLAASLFGPAAFVQSAESSWNGLPDRFQVDTGYFRLSSLYIEVSPGESEASVSDWRIGADYYFFKNAGLGVQYKYNRYSYDRGVLVSELGGEITYQGFQAFVSFLF